MVVHLDSCEMYKYIQQYINYTKYYQSTDGVFAESMMEILKSTTLLLVYFNLVTFVLTILMVKLH